MTINELCKRVYKARRAVMRMNLRMPEDTVVVISIPDYYAVLQERAPSRDLWHGSFGPLQRTLEGCTVYGLKMVPDQGLNPGEIRLRQEVDA